MEELSVELVYLYEDIGRSVALYSYPSPELVAKFERFRVQALEMEKEAEENDEQLIIFKTENLYAFLSRCIDDMNSQLEY